MPVYNALRYLDEAVRSILGQTCTNFELVIIDDGSTDGSESLLRDFAAADRRIRLRRRKNTGYAVALNEGLSLARGEFVARMDADDVSMPRRFERQAAYLRLHPECVAVGCHVLVTDPDGLPICESFPLQTHEEIDGLHLTGRGAGIAHPSVMMRRADLVAVGGYRPEFEPAEDLDLWLRLAERGRLANVDEVLFRYRRHDSAVSVLRSAQQVRQTSAAVADAHCRRGLPFIPLEDFPASAPRTNRIPDAAWVAAALEAGNYNAARRLALKALRKRPLSSQSWWLIFTSVLGRRAPLARRALAALRSTQSPKQVRPELASTAGSRQHRQQDLEK